MLHLWPNFQHHLPSGWRQPGFLQCRGESLAFPASLTWLCTAHSSAGWGPPHIPPAGALAVIVVVREPAPPSRPAPDHCSACGHLRRGPGGGSEPVGSDGKEEKSRGVCVPELAGYSGQLTRMGVLSAPLWRPPEQPYGTAF